MLRAGGGQHGEAPATMSAHSHEAANLSFAQTVRAVPQQVKEASLVYSMLTERD